MNTSQRLKYIRQITGLSQERFAEKLNEKFSRINSIESGKQIKFPYDLAEKILKAFPEKQYSFQWITTGKGEPVLKEVISPEKQRLIEMAEKVFNKFTKNITNEEFNLISDCLSANKELMVMLLKKLQDNEKAVKKFLLSD